MMKKEHEEQKQQWNPGWMNQGMIHHHHDHETYDQGRSNQKQKL